MILTFFARGEFPPPFAETGLIFSEAIANKDCTEIEQMQFYHQISRLITPCPLFTRGLNYNRVLLSYLRLGGHILNYSLRQSSKKFTRPRG